MAAEYTEEHSKAEKLFASVTGLRPPGRAGPRSLPEKAKQITGNCVYIERIVVPAIVFKIEIKALRDYNRVSLAISSSIHFS